MISQNGGHGTVIGGEGYVSTNGGSNGNKISSNGPTDDIYYPGGTDSEYTLFLNVTLSRNVKRFLLNIVGIQNYCNKLSNSDSLVVPKTNS